MYKLQPTCPGARNIPIHHFFTLRQWLWWAGVNQFTADMPRDTQPSNSPLFHSAPMSLRGRSERSYSRHAPGHSTFQFTIVSRCSNGFGGLACTNYSRHAPGHATFQFTIVSFCSNGSGGLACTNLQPTCPGALNIPIPPCFTLLQCLVIKRSSKAGNSSGRCSR